MLAGILRGGKKAKAYARERKGGRKDDGQNARQRI